MRERVAYERPSAYVRRRGSFMDKGERVYANVPATLHPLTENQMPNRLGLAHWIVDPENPLTARVAVNRAWEQFFGRGIVETSEDFGTQGTPPSHPELLDWLATELVEQEWHTKAIHKAIVLSAAYRQSSAASPSLEERDPYNRLIARGPRFRMEAEMVRDAVLTVSGLLSRKIGGPSVFPPMPADIAALTYATSFKWKNSEGQDRYRRGLYTSFKRTSPYPALTTFDCPDSNTTCVQRRASNTPLQALTALNTEVFTEAARYFARWLLDQQGAGDRELLTLGFRKTVARAPTAEELLRLTQLLNRSLDWYRNNPAEAKRLGGKTGTPEEAAWTAVARVLLNLDEFLTRE